jgi:tRNA threonylcarbamoyladenosine biosynthesis protein TsaB
MRILSADTSSKRTALALYRDGEVIEMNSTTETPSAARFFVLMESLLGTARMSLDEIDYLALGAGPGSFTGLRVSFTAFRTLAWARSIPLYPINSLLALAYPYRALDASLVVRMAARRGHVYQYAVRAGKCIDELALLSYEEARARARALPAPQFLLGLAEEEAPELPRLVQSCGPDAASIAHLALDAIALGAPPNLKDVLPLYLRPSDAELSLLEKA